MRQTGNCTEAEIDGTGTVAQLTWLRVAKCGVLVDLTFSSKIEDDDIISCHNKWSLSMLKVAERSNAVVFVQNTIMKRNRIQRLEDEPDS